jgi:aminopeptidase N
VTRGTTKDGVSVEVYTVPSHYAQAPGRVNTILSDAVRSIEQMSAWVGPYPYPVYRVVDAGLSMPGGIEFPMLSMIGSRLNGVGVLVSHETAHQWFFGLLGTHPQTETWVDEGAASFFEEAIYSGIDTPVTLDRALPCRVSIPVWDMSIPFRDHYFCVYDGGREVYATIRDTMGADRFVAALHDLYTQDRYGIITARDMLTIFQQHSATDLRPALRDELSYDWLDSLPAPGG